MRDFVYLDSALHIVGSKDEIKRRIASAGQVCAGLQKPLCKRREMSPSVKRRACKARVTSVFPYGSESWNPKQFEMKVIGYSSSGGV